MHACWYVRCKYYMEHTHIMHIHACIHTIHWNFFTWMHAHICDCMNLYIYTWTDAKMPTYTHTLQYTQVAYTPAFMHNFISKNTFLHVGLRLCMYTRWAMYVCVHVYMYVHTNMHLCVPTNMPTIARTWVCVDMRVCMYVYTYAYACIYISTQPNEAEAGRKWAGCGVWGRYIFACLYACMQICMWFDLICFYYWKQ